MVDDDKPEPTVKQLLDRDRAQPLEDVVDAATAAELERWFGLPSYQQVEDGEVALPTEDPEMVAARERREAAIAAVDPALLEAHRRRVDNAEELIQFVATIDVHVDPDVMLFDTTMVDRRMSIAEPRELERPEGLEDDLKDATPQALLRDLHRPELEFEKLFDIVDVAAEQKLDAGAAVREVIATSWKLPELGEPPAMAMRKVLADLRAEYDAPWSELPRRAVFPNRTVED